MNYHYPDDVDPKDPKAPWNQQEPEMTEWECVQVEDCFVCEKENVQVDDKYICQDCFEPEEVESCE